MPQVCPKKQNKQTKPNTAGAGVLSMVEAPGAVCVRETGRGRQASCVLLKKSGTGCCKHHTCSHPTGWNFYSTYTLRTLQVSCLQNCIVSPCSSPPLSSPLESLDKNLALSLLWLWLLLWHRFDPCTVNFMPQAWPKKYFQRMNVHG